MSSSAAGAGPLHTEDKAIVTSRPAPYYLKIFYIVLNVFAACSIVFANKIVFSTFQFKFVTTLTLIHTVFTWTGMLLLQRFAFFEPKKFTQWEIAPLALGYVGYVVLNNLSLNLNTVGLYQILKITITPTVIVLEFLLFRKVQTLRVLLAVLVVCVGVAAAAVTDTVAISNLVGVAVGLSSVVITGLYQIWAGSKQKELRANSSQLLMGYTPQAMAVLALLAPLLDDLGLRRPPRPDTVLGFPYTPAAVTAIGVSGLLGVLVSLSTFLVIGATSSLTYNVVGHSKTILILAGGCLLFNEAMPWKRLLGIVITMGGIAWYTVLTVQQQPAASSVASAFPAAGTVHRDKLIGAAQIQLLQQQQHQAQQALLGGSGTARYSVREGGRAVATAAAGATGLPAPPSTSEREPLLQASELRV